MEVRVTVNQKGVDQFAQSPGVRQLLDALAFTITAHAVPHSGVDTGRLVGSMSHRVVPVDGVLEAQLGSGAADDVNPVYYWAYNWAGEPAPNQEQLPKPGPGERLPSRQTQPRPTPTRPYTKALDELGIDYRNDGGLQA
jgi:hypothetical protein